LAKPRRFRALAALAVLAAIILLVLLVPTLRRDVLRAAGWALVAEDPLQPANLIVLSTDAGDAGVLEAVDLLHRGLAPRVAIFSTLLTPAAYELRRRGVPYSDTGLLERREFEALGIPSAAIEDVTPRVSGTTDETKVLPSWCAQQRCGAVIFISTTDHSRRSRRALHRALDGSPTHVILHYSRYSYFDPNRWWLTRTGIRTELTEAQKLLFELLRHP
jgi:hypothetical protein